MNQILTSPQKNRGLVIPSNPLSVLLLVIIARQDFSEQSVAGEIHGIGAGIEEELVESAVQPAAAAKGKVPQARNHERISAGIPQRANQRAGVRVEGVDFSVFDV